MTHHANIPVLGSPIITSEPTDRKTLAIGAHIWLVEGAVRWAIYDLLLHHLIRIDRRSGEILCLLAQSNIDYCEKMSMLADLPKLETLCNKYQLTNRLFHEDTSDITVNTSLKLLWLEVTHSCNQKCIHCYTESRPNRKEMMPLNRAFDWIKQGRECGFREIQFTGGEPFIHKNLWEMVAYARELNYPNIEIYTNLTLTKYEDFLRMKQLGVRLATSLLGPNAQVHDSCTQTPGSFDKWYKNIKIVQSLDLPYRIGVVRMRQNENHIRSIEAFLRHEELISASDTFNSSDVHPTGSAVKNDVMPSIPEYSCSPRRINAQFFHTSRYYNSCWRGILAIAPTGDVYPCVFARSLIVGNLTQSSLKAIVQKLYSTYWKIPLASVAKCKDCEFRYACTDCRALSLDYYKDLYGPPVRCDYNPYMSAYFSLKKLPRL